MSLSTSSHDPAIDAQSKAAEIYVVATAFAAVTTLVVALRLYTRCCILNSPGLDDWSILIAQVLAIVVSVLTSLEAVHGIGRHTWTVSAVDLREQVKYLYCLIILYNLGLNIVKISFLLQYRRIFTSNRVRKICAWLMGYVSVWAAVQGTLLGLSCIPLSVILPQTGGFCLDTLPIWYFSSAMSLFTDISIFIVPLPSLRKIQLQGKQKVLIFGIFCLGFFVCIISIIRMFSLREAIETADPAYSNTEAAIWSLVELNTAILCSCLPTLRPLLARFTPGTHSATHSSKGYQKYGYGTSRAAGGSLSRSIANTRKSKSLSVEELALAGVPAAHNQDTGVFASCTAKVKSDEELVDVPAEYANVQNQIIVRMETVKELSAAPDWHSPV